MRPISLPRSAYCTATAADLAATSPPRWFSLPIYLPGRHLKDMRVCRIYEGTDQVSKLKIAADFRQLPWGAGPGDRRGP